MLPYSTAPTTPPTTHPPAVYQRRPLTGTGACCAIRSLLSPCCRPKRVVCHRRPASVSCLLLLPHLTQPACIHLKIDSILILPYPSCRCCPIPSVTGQCHLAWFNSEILCAFVPFDFPLTLVSILPALDSSSRLSISSVPVQYTTDSWFSSHGPARGVTRRG